MKKYRVYIDINDCAIHQVYSKFPTKKDITDLYLELLENK